MPGTAAPAWTTSLIIHAVSKRPATKSAHHRLHGISRAALDYFGTPKSFSIAPVGRSPPSARVTRSARRPRRFCAPAFPPSALAAPARRAPERPARGSGLLRQTPPLPYSPLPATPRRPAAFALPRACPRALAALL
ncbi:hypothetical protein B0H14DRAFT_3438682 [Mycena olivaceomarginata]|nr:hypothetical protein B0H14DRAFT_3438682 [Mycena olivaceomarginata]